MMMLHAKHDLNDNIDMGKTDIFPAAPLKRGHICFGLLDARKAVVIVNLFRLGFSMQTLSDDIQDGEYGRMIGYSIAFFIFRVSCIGCAIYGAACLLEMYVAASLFAVLVDNFLAAWIDGPLDPLILVELIYFAYPHVILIQEIKNGIMSAETYSTEEYPPDILRMFEVTDALLGAFNRG
jgi:hypothetical protein